MNGEFAGRRKHQRLQTITGRCTLDHGEPKRGGLSRTGAGLANHVTATTGKGDRVALNFGREFPTKAIDGGLNVGREVPRAEFGLREHPVRLRSSVLRAAGTVATLARLRRTLRP